MIDQTLQRYIAGYDQNDADLCASAFAEDAVIRFDRDATLAAADPVLKAILEDAAD